LASPSWLRWRPGASLAAFIGQQRLASIIDTPPVSPPRQPSSPCCLELPAGGDEEDEWQFPTSPYKEQVVVLTEGWEQPDSPSAASEESEEQLAAVLLVEGRRPPAPLISAAPPADTPSAIKTLTRQLTRQLTINK
jgi:hypothetical protein